MKAGARSAETVLKLLLGEENRNDTVISNGAVYSRFDQSVCVQEGEKRQRVRGVIFDLDDTLYSENSMLNQVLMRLPNILAGPMRLINCGIIL